MAAITQRRIDFDNDPVVNKPANLANSAVLRMLEEEERQQKSGYKRVAWPPPADTQIPASQPIAQQQQQQPQSQQQPQYQQYPSQDQQPQYKSTTNFQPQPNSPNYGQSVPQYYPEPQQYQQPPPQQQQQQFNSYRQPSPGTVTLRTEAPVSQRPAPVYSSQPPVSSFKGGVNMRGDMKWPPEEYKKAAAVENEERLRLAAGPACRPRRVNKDYRNFFARHALNSTYPGYKVPPGTQHYSQ